MRKRNKKRGINSPYYLGDFLPYFFNKNKNKINFEEFFEKTGIDPTKFKSPLYLVSLSTKEQYDAVRRYLSLDKITFLQNIIKYDRKGAIVVPSMERRKEMLNGLLKKSLGQNKGCAPRVPLR